MQLRRKFLLSLVLVAVVISGVMFVTFNSQRSAAIDEAQTDIDDRAGQTASTLDQRLRSNQQTLQVVADDPRLSDHGTDAQRTALETVQSLDGVGGVSVVDRDGEMVNLVTVTGGSPDTVIGQDYSDREYVTSALAGEEYISEPLRAATGNRIVVLSMPIYEGNDIVGTLNAALYLDGSFFQSAVGLRNISDTSVSVMSGTEALFQSEEQFDTTISGTATVQSTGWTVTVDHREGAVTEEIQRLALVQIGSSLVLLAAVGGFGLWIYRNHIRQTERLQTRLEQLEQRRYDQRISLTGSNEWTEINEAVDRLASALARREQMLLVLNRLLRHNLRNTLNVVIGRIGRLDTADDKTVREIVETCKQLLTMSDRARMTERLVTRDADRHDSVVDLVEVLEHQIESFEDRYPNVTTAVEAPKAAHVSADPAVATAIDELLTNVGQHAGADPTVEIEIRRIDDQVELRISDDGAGIPAEERSVFTGEKQISHLHHSGGLGLWLVDWIVSQSGGTVEIRSDSGTTVVIRLPAVEQGQGST
ncbi:ATP-binding protein [Natronoarchaeum sp. GCM10025321]|uniref:sensor histidine kinase n=2 Tax=unclassified Natronoarchaeum TaxID=2620183 RepID=UPI003615CE39